VRRGPSRCPSRRVTGFRGARGETRPFKTVGQGEAVALTFEGRLPVGFERSSFEVAVGGGQRAERLRGRPCRSAFEARRTRDLFETEARDFESAFERQRARSLRGGLAGWLVSACPARVAFERSSFEVAGRRGLRGGFDAAFDAAFERGGRRGRWGLRGGRSVWAICPTRLARRAGLRDGRSAWAGCPARLDGRRSWSASVGLRGRVADGAVWLVRGVAALTFETDGFERDGRPGGWRGCPVGSLRGNARRDGQFEERPRGLRGDGFEVMAA
jgi:hypothetical protein